MRRMILSQPAPIATGPLASAKCAKCAPYFASLSRSRNRGRTPSGVASRSCWVTHASVGWRVTPT